MGNSNISKAVSHSHDGEGVVEWLPAHRKLRFCGLPPELQVLASRKDSLLSFLEFDGLMQRPASVELGQGKTAARGTKPEPPS
jgi:hypothetical protein